MAKAFVLRLVWPDFYQQRRSPFYVDTTWVKIRCAMPVQGIRMMPVQEKTMSPQATANFEAFFSNFSAGRRPHLLLDYDGTLAPFRVDRFRSRPWAGIRELLQKIKSQGSTRMAVITGRPAAEIAPMLELDSPLEAWGLHGTERLYPDGRRELDAVTPALSLKLKALYELLRQDSFGGLLEEKANGAVIHWRGRSARQIARIEGRTRELFEPIARKEGLTLLQFDGGIELRAGRNKGGAVEAILSETPADRLGPIAYLGDDLADEAAFRAVNHYPQGLSLLVRRKPRQTDAQLWIRPPAPLREFLARWLAAVAG